MDYNYFTVPYSHFKWISCYLHCFELPFNHNFNIGLFFNVMSTTILYNYNYNISLNDLHINGYIPMHVCMQRPCIDLVM